MELKDEIEINKQDKGGRTPLHYAAEQADPAMVNVLIRDDKINLSLEDNNSMTPLDRSAFRGSAQTVKAILSSRVNPHTINTSGRALLHYAASCGQPYTIKALIEAGAHVKCAPAVRCTSAVHAEYPVLFLFLSSSRLLRLALPHRGEEL